MYTSFFNLQCKPFEIAADAGFLWLGGKHQEALAALRYGILENKGFVLVTGGPGSGKTTLVNALIASLDQGVLSAVVADPSRDRLDFYNAIAAAFGLNREFASKVQFLIQFSQFLHKAADEGKKVLLVIDDCQRLSQEMIEELRLLSNIEKADAKLINIFFVGQGEFNETLIQPNNRAIRQRLTVRADLPPLSFSESVDYICHRLRVAGTGERLFSDKALQVVHQYAKGVPKRINIICDHALVAGCVQGKRHIDDKIVAGCLQQLNMPLNPTSEDFDRLEGEKSHLEHLRGRFLPAGDGGSSGVSDNHLEHRGRLAWGKYVASALALAAIASAYWYFGIRTPSVAIVEPVEKPGTPAITAPVSMPAVPVVTAREEKSGEIRDERAVERVGTAPEKASGQGASDRVATAGESAATTPREAPELTTSIPPPKKSAEASIAPPAPLSEARAETPLKAPPTPVAAAPQPRLPPVPAKVILPLAANSLKLTPEGNAELRSLLEKLPAAPGSRLLVKGFVSSSTASPANTKLSEERAMAVQKLLVAGGIEAGRLEVRGMGIEEPIATNDTPEGRTQNRRVEIIILNGGSR